MLQTANRFHIGYNQSLEKKSEYLKQTVVTGILKSVYI